FANRDLLADTEVDGIRAVVPIGRENDAFSRIVNVEKLTRGATGATDLDVRTILLARVHALLDYRGYDVRALGVEIVARAVKVNGQQVDRVETVLRAVRLSLDQQHLLCEPVRRVGLLRVPVPKVFLAKRDGGELRIRADRPDGDELRDAVLPRLLHKFDPHDRVVVKEFPGPRPIGADPADYGSQVDHDVGPATFKCGADGSAITQVVVSVTRNKHFRHTGEL